MKAASKLLLCTIVLTLCCCRGFDSVDRKPAGENRTLYPTRGPSPEDVQGALADEVREIIRPACGSCHTSTLPTAKSDAVRIFDLVRDDWVEMMSTENLEGFRRRLDKFREPDRTKVIELVQRRLGIMGVERQ